ncbi:DUF4244 domain-containing protein [Leucobacter sp. HY1910]
METRLQLVPTPHDDGIETPVTAQGDTLHFVTPRRRRARSWWGRGRASLHSRVARASLDDDGAVTAEYAIVIMAAVAFAGLLVAILRSAEIRAMLVQLVEDALGAAG